MYCVHEPVFISPDMAMVNIEAFEKEDKELLRLGRVNDALNLMNLFEEHINNGAKNGYIEIDHLIQTLQNLKSYDPNNK